MLNVPPAISELVRPRAQRLSQSELVEAARRLHQFLFDNHWNGAGVIGPDVGIRFNLRLGRFVKSYLRWIHWNDSYYYLQTQAYWIFANWQLHHFTGDPHYRDIAIRASEHAMERQRPDGAWDYPNPEWKGRVATAEGTWGSLGLLESYRYSGQERFLAAAQRWHKYLFSTIGFASNGSELAVRYFAERHATPPVPNNSAFVLRFLSELACLSGDREYVAPCQGMMLFMNNAQKSNGEFPYMVKTASVRGKCWEHFQCYQYNAFQCMDLMRYYENTYDQAAPGIIRRCLKFLEGGVGSNGQCHYDCGNSRREVTYNAGVMGAAFVKAERLKLTGYNSLADRCYRYLLQVQRADGSFPHSRNDYIVLNDDRAYPRGLSMILCHFMEKVVV